MKGYKAAKQPKEVTNHALEKHKSQMKKMQKQFVLLYLLTNKGIDFFADCFTKRDCSTQFFYIKHYSLDRLGNHPARNHIRMILDTLLMEIKADKKMSCCTKQNKTTNALVQLCKLLDVDLTVDEVNDKEKDKVFPKIKGIGFNETPFDPTELFAQLQIEQKLNTFVEDNHLNKKEQLIRMTSLGLDDNTIDSLSQNIQFSVLLKNTIDQNATCVTFIQNESTVNETNEDTLIQTNSPTPQSSLSIESNQQIQSFTIIQSFQMMINNTLCSIHLCNNNYCFIVDPFGNTSYIPYNFDENQNFCLWY